MELVIFRKKHTLLTIIGACVFLIALSTAITYLFVGNNLFSSFQKYILGIVYGFTIGLTFWLGNWAIGYNTGTRLNWRKNPKRANMLSLLFFLIYGIVASITVPFIFHWFVFNHREGIANIVITSGFMNLCIDLVFISIYYSKYLIHYYDQALRNVEELKRENLEAKYEALKSQVNPHFLFNSLNTLAGVVEQNPENAVEFIKKLSDIYRYVLEQHDKEMVPVKEELRFVDDYLFLAKIRHGNALKSNIQVTNTNVLVVPLGLQILVENAIKHNVISADQPLTIEIFTENDYIVVKNNLQKKSSTIRNKSLGLENLKNRYGYLSKKTVEIFESDQFFMVKLPIIEFMV